MQGDKARQTKIKKPLESFLDNDARVVCGAGSSKTVLARPFFAAIRAKAEYPSSLGGGSSGNSSGESRRVLLCGHGGFESLHSRECA